MKYLIILLLNLVLISAVSADNSNIGLITLDVTLHRDIKNSMGLKSKVDYRIWTDEHKAQFIILSGSGSSGNFSKIDQLKQGQIVKVEINEKDEKLLSNKLEEIVIHSLKVGNVILLSKDEMEVNQSNYQERKRTLLIIASIILVLYYGFKFLRRRISG